MERAPGPSAASEPTVPRGTKELLAAYAGLVRWWSPRLGLVSPGDLARLEDRHITDCLRALALVDSLPSGPAIDVGSGAGLPGIPLAIAGRPRLWRLLEPMAKRAAFLEEAVRSLGLGCEVVRATVEEVLQDDALIGTHAVAIARALAPPPHAFARLLPLVAPGGAAVVFVGPGAELPPGAEESPSGIATIGRPAG